VERRAPVSEEALEAHFNGLSSVSRPKDLKAKPPFAEELQHFSLTSKGPLALMAKPQKDTATADTMLNGPHGQPQLLQRVWDAKEELDEIWNRPPPPMGRSLMQRVARDELFPHSGKEGKEHENRAGEKLEELAQAVGLLEGVPKDSAFLDLCGGPGAWSQYLLAQSELSLRGFGFTLKSSSGDDADWHSQEKDDWYPELLRDPAWTALWGEDGTGDLLKPGNLEHSTKQLRKQGGVFLCVADGGFSDKAIPANLLELYFYRLLLAELLTAISCLQPGGRFVCKLYTSCSAATSALLFLTTRLFKESSIVKPMTSRVAGPERYLYASGFQVNAEVEEIRAALSASHVFGDGMSPMSLPLLTPVVSAEQLALDEDFMEQLQAMVAQLCKRQSGSLRAILDRAEQLEQMALDVSRRATEGAGRWAAAAAAQRESAESQEQEQRGQERRWPGRNQGFGLEGLRRLPRTGYVSLCSRSDP